MSTPYLDAYTSGNGDVVTRAYQGNSTQLWCFTKVGEVPDPTDAGVMLPYYTIQHRSFTGQYLDAYESTNDHKVVLRNAQNNASQEWIRSNTCPMRFQQRNTGRYLDAYTSGENYRAVTRSFEDDGTQGWMFGISAYPSPP